MAVVENRGPELLKVCITLLTFAVIATLLRCYTRLWVVKAFGADDWTMVFACISFILFVASAITGIHYGTGRHATDLSTPDFEEAMKYWWFCYIWYCVTMITSKISIGIFLLRITVHKMHRYILYIVMFLSVVSGLVFFFVTLFQCQPMTYFWAKAQGGTCVSPVIIAALTYLYSAFSVICDFTFALLPVVLIRGLQMDSRIKWALIPILSMACVASVAVVVRFAYIKDFLDPDFLWATVDIAIWSTTEQGLAITAGSLATLQPLAKRTAQRFGYWETRNTKPLSDDALPRTIGSLGQSKNRIRAQSNGDFSLTTLDWEDNRGQPGRDGARQALPKDQIILTKEVAVTSKRGSLWGGGGGEERNDSEEELTKSSTKDAYGVRVAPKSWLDDK
ncbi:hypothetical protein JX265_005900 [Neoarthrinium moseri]|uniref:Rhodopsin domain-containing protein n=1 Tax=Neoarthrinium moseri TaxID=1658444 RepID=A0A9P9WNK2_9PEZI|nr:uncharacterized protein JN550_002148 [Neoarthrinium moseri]KAI1871914.1 hypothetical protein JX265_005900 [Neoarthrinium moseri]KAI1875862.1 hypothetical protein JN550_002148 [Neoarthrinium moseri]